ncbi:MAG TPA: TolC family protein [Spirochaetia bacterium]|nr:TolC family protein [Spirochaetia bacterium]
MKRTVMILAALCAPLLSGFAQQTLPVITLQQSIDAALANGEGWKILQGNLSVVRAQYAENVSRNSLTLSGSLGAGYNAAVYDSTGILASKANSLSSSSTSPQIGQVGIGLTGPLTNVSVSAVPWSPPIGNTASLPGYGDTTASLGVNVSQTVWNGYPGGSTQATVDKSLLNLQGQELSTESARLALIYQVKQAYYAMFTALQDLQTRQQILQRQSALLDQITAVYNLKQASEVDLKTAQINAHSAEIDVRSSEHTLRLARIRLANIMAMPPDSQFTVVQPPEAQVPAATLADAVSLALSRRVDMKLIQLNKRSNAIDIAAARGQATPTVSVGGGASVYMDYSLNNAWAGLVNAGVRVSMPVLDAGAAQNLVDAGTRLDGVYTVQMSQLQKSIAADVQDAWEAVELQKERVELARQTAENDDLLVEVYKVQSRNGTASTQDLLTASVNAANARTASVQAQAAAQLAVLQLLSVMGY